MDIVDVRAIYCKSINKGPYDGPKGSSGSTVSTASLTKANGQRKSRRTIISDNENHGLRSTTATTQEIIPTRAAWDEDGYYQASFSVGRSRRYHAMMQRFYQSLHDWVMAGNALMGAGAFVVLIGGSGTLLATLLTGFVAAASALDTVFGPSKKASLHGDLARRFTELAADIERFDATPRNLRKVKASRLTIEADEPPVRRLVDLAAHNEECLARGHDAEHLVPITVWQRRLGYYRDFGLETIDKELASRQKTG